MEGVYEIIYVKHLEDKHDKCVERKKGWKRIERPTSDAPLSTATPNSQKLALSNNLKAAMVTNSNCTEAQANTVLSEVVQNRLVN